MEFKSHASLDIKSRLNKAKKIEAVLHDLKDIKKCRILDIGCGSGSISSYLGKISKKVWGIDVVDERIIHKNFNFKKVKDELLPFKKNFFDVIISNVVIEHLNNQDKHLKEIYRTLKKGGICYLVAPNKWNLKEPHYGILFLSWLPKKLADYYVKLRKKTSKYDINPLSLRAYYKLFSKNGFLVVNYSPKILKYPEKYKLERSFISKITSKIPLSLINKLNFLIPTYVFILKKI